MPIQIQHDGAGRYTASVTPSRYRNVSWETSHPLRPQELIDALVELGYHLQDIADAFYDADPGWVHRRNDEVGGAG